MLEIVFARINRGILGYLTRRQVNSRVSRLLRQGGFARRQLLQALDLAERRCGAKRSLQEAAPSGPPGAA